MSAYYEYTTDTVDYGTDDFDFVTMLYEFDSEEVIEEPDPVFYLYLDEDVTPPPPIGEEFVVGDGIVLSFRDPRALNPYMALNIEGLDVSKVKAKYYRGSFGERFYNLTLDERKIVLLIGLNPDYIAYESYSELRDFLYKIISASKTGMVRLYFKNGNTVIATVDGFAEKVETTPFDRSQRIQLTVNCNDPLLKSPTETVLDLDLLSNAITIDDQDSTAPHGFSFLLEFDGAAPNLSISDQENSWFFTMAPVGGFLNGDLLYFSSELNDRQLHIIRDSAVIDMMKTLVSGSIWPIVFPGVNEFALNRTNFTWRRIAYYKRYWGV